MEVNRIKTDLDFFNERGVKEIAALYVSGNSGEKSILLSSFC